MNLQIQSARLSKYGYSIIISAKEYEDRLYININILKKFGYTDPRELVGRTIEIKEEDIIDKGSWMQVVSIKNISPGVRTEDISRASKVSDIENQLIDIDEKLEKNPVYKKMLNNLLGIGSRDNAIFTSSKVNNIDLKSIVSSNDFNKIFAKGSFSITINNYALDNVIRQLSEAQNIENFLNIIDFNSIHISIADRKLLESDFENNQNAIISKIKNKKNKKVSM